VDAYKLRVKIGAAEFEAEGAEDTVKAQFEEFKSLLAAPTGPQAQTLVTPAPAGNGANQRGATVTAEQTEDVPQGFERLFAVDDSYGRKAVTLRLLPQGEDREWVALLLLLWGFKRKFGEERIRVTVLKDVLERSGLTIDRVDRVADKPQRNGLLLKGGKAKGGTYALTNTGQARAEQEFKQLLEQM